MCVLRVSGKDLDPTSVVGLEPCTVYRLGEPRWRSRPDGPRWDTSGFNVAVSEAPWSDLRKQISDACAFLDRHAEEIRTLRAGGAVEDMSLDFPVHQRIGVSTLTQFEFFPAELVQKAGSLGLGLELSIYPSDTGVETKDG
jgi:hypothetical protein